MKQGALITPGGKGNSEKWPTPPAMFDELNGEFGFSLDVCASPENAKCGRYFTAQDDGLSQDWGSETCWMNPPYGREIGKWMAKAWDAAGRGATVVCLLPARTDTAWWHDFAMKAEVRFIRGRIRFDGAKHFAPFPSVIVVMRPRIA